MPCERAAPKELGGAKGPTEMDTLRFGKLLVFVTSLGEAKRFYGDVLGLSLASEANDMLFFRQPDFELAIFSCREAAAPHRPVRQRPRDL